MSTTDSTTADDQTPQNPDATDAPETSEAPEASEAQGSSPSSPGTKFPVIATAGRYYRNARYIMVTLMIGFSGMFFYDGFIGYPKQNNAAIEKARAAGEKEKFDASGKYIVKPERTDTDIALQKVLGVVLLPLGFGYLYYFLHKSRGAYRFDGQTISLPGHPDFTLGDVVRVDKKLWDRKGIAQIEYKTPDGKTGTATIDDFIYDRKPTDIIYDAVIAELKSRDA